MSFFTTESKNRNNTSTGKYPEVMNVLRPLPLKVALAHSSKLWHEKGEQCAGSPVSISFRKSESEGTPRQWDDYCKGELLLDFEKAHDLASPSFDEENLANSKLNSPVKPDFLKMGLKKQPRHRYMSPTDRRVEPKPMEVLKNAFRRRYEEEFRAGKQLCEV